MSDGRSRADVLSQIRNPLVFFGLALLVIEAIVATMVVKSGMSGDQQYRALWIMAALFLFVIVIVALITIVWPEHLYENIDKRLRRTEEVAKLLESDAFRDYIEEIVATRIQLEYEAREAQEQEEQQQEEEAKDA